DAAIPARDASGRGREITLGTRQPSVGPKVNGPSIQGGVLLLRHHNGERCYPMDLAAASAVIAGRNSTLPEVCIIHAYRPGVRHGSHRRRTRPDHLAQGYP